MKRHRTALLLGLLLVFVIGLVFVQNQTRIVPGFPEIHRANSPTANDCQANAATQLWADGGKLYLYNRESAAWYQGLNLNRGKLIELDPGGRRVLLGRGDSRRLLGVAGGFCYSLEVDLAALDAQLCVRQLQTGAETRYPLEQLLEGRERGEMRTSYTDDGRLTLIFDGNKDSVGIVMDGADFSLLPYEEPRLVLSDRSYYVDRSARQLVSVSASGKKAVVYEWKGDKEVSLFPLEDSLLLYVPDSTKPLVRIDAEGQPSVLFSFNSKGSPPTAMNILDGNIYLSVQRYARTDSFYSLPASVKDDPISGTYLIRAEESSVEKIDDTVYTGLYVFDDGFLYACDRNGSVFQFSAGWDRIAVIYDNASLFSRLVSWAS